MPCVTDAAVRGQRAMERGLPLEQRPRPEVGAVQPEQIEREERGRISHSSTLDAHRTALRMALVQAIPLRPALSVEHDELAVGNEVVGIG